MRLDDAVEDEEGDVGGADVVVQVGQAQVVSLAAGPAVPKLLEEVGEGAAAGVGFRGRDLM